MEVSVDLCNSSGAANSLGREDAVPPSDPTYSWLKKSCLKFGSDLVRTTKCDHGRSSWAYHSNSSWRRCTVEELSAEPLRNSTWQRCQDAPMLCFVMLPSPWKSTTAQGVPRCMECSGLGLHHHCLHSARHPADSQRWCDNVLRILSSQSQQQVSSLRGRTRSLGVLSLAGDCCWSR